MKPKTSPKTKLRQTTASKPHYHHGDLPRALVSAGIGLIEDSGAHGLTLRAAALAVGVSVAAPYRHFASREALLAACLTEGFQDLARRTQAARMAVTDPKAALIATAVAYVGFAAEHPRIYRLMFGPECDKASFPALMAAGQEARAVLHSAVAACGKTLDITASDIPEVALSGWALTHGLASLYVDGMITDGCPPKQLPGVVSRMAEVLIAGWQSMPRG